jgi:Sec-independent protein translocase protein TatA
MVALMANLSMLAQIFGGWEVVLMLAVFFILLGAKTLPKMAKGLGDGTSQISKELDQEAHEAGKSLGGIYGRPAAEALTPENQTAELYDPAVFHDQKRTGRATKRTWFRSWCRFWRSVWNSVLKRFKTKTTD